MISSLSEFKDRCARDGYAWPDRAPPVEFLWRFELRASRAELWPFIADTSSFNREIALARRTQREEAGRTVVDTTMLGLPQRWSETPWSWIVGEMMSNERFYDFGMAKHARVVFRIDGADEDPCRVVSAYFGWTPRNSAWGWFLRLTENPIREKFRAAFAKADEHCRARRTTPGFADSTRLARSSAAETVSSPPVLVTPAAVYRKTAPPLPPHAKARLEEHRVALIARGLDGAVVHRLCDHLESADDPELEALRVLELARDWRLDPSVLLAVCLHATKRGLLRMSWKIVCPHCRGARLTVESLGDVPPTADCAPCAASFRTDRDNAVEIVFQPHDSVRHVEESLYCSAEPAKKAHIKAKCAVPAGGFVRLRPELAAGEYRVRTLDGVVSSLLTVRDGEEPQWIEHRNPGAVPRVLIVEDTRWEGRPLKPAHVLSHADFRDLFSTEYLRADVQLYLGEQVVVFTDIVGSTLFYREVGDARAFAEVRAHFREVYEEVRRHRGAVVKTIGDAVMAAFPAMSDALEGAAAILRRFPAGRADTSIRLRASVHGGPMIAVKLNTGVDYFGSTVNYAAKIQGVAQASEIAMTGENLAAFARTAPAGSFSAASKPNAHGPEPLFAVKIL